MNWLDRARSELVGSEGVPSNGSIGSGSPSRFRENDFKRQDKRITGVRNPPPPSSSRNEAFNSHKSAGDQLPILPLEIRTTESQPVPAAALPPLLIPVPANAAPPPSHCHRVEDAHGALLWCVVETAGPALIHRFYLDGLSGPRWCPVELADAVARSPEVAALVGDPAAFEAAVLGALDGRGSPVTLTVSGAGSVAASGGDR